MGWLKIGGKCPSEMVRLLPRRVVLKSKKNLTTAQHLEKKIRLRLRRSPFCLPFQISRGLLGAKVGNLMTRLFHVGNDSQQRADKTGEAGFVGLILEK